MEEKISALPGVKEAIAKSHGDRPLRRLSCETPVLCKQACTRDWGIGGTQQAIQHTKPHPGCVACANSECFDAFLTIVSFEYNIASEALAILAHIATSWYLCNKTCTIDRIEGQFPGDASKEKNLQMRMPMRMLPMESLPEAARSHPVSSPRSEVSKTFSSPQLPYIAR